MTIISIHALREEGDPEIAFHTYRQYGISIHALREEGDDYQTFDSPLL